METFKVKYINPGSPANGQIFEVREDNEVWPHHYLDVNQKGGTNTLAKKYCQLIEEGIEEAVIVEENGVAVLDSNFEKPTLPVLLDKEGSIAKIKASLANYKDVVIADTSDTKNYKLVVAGMKELKDSRLAWVKSVKENILEPAKLFYDTIKSDITAIEAEFKTSEQLLRDKKDAIDLKKEQEKKAEEERKTKVLGERIEKLVTLGGKSTNGGYVFDYDLTICISISALRDFTEDEFTSTIAEVQTAYNAEEKRKSDLAIEQENQRKANVLLQAQLNEKRTRLRRKELLYDEFDMNTPGFYTKNGVKFTDDDILNFTDEHWDSLIEEASIIPTDSPEKEEIVRPNFGGGGAMKPSASFETTDVAKPTPSKGFVMPVIDDEGEEPAMSQLKLSSTDVVLSHTFTEEKPYLSFIVGKFIYRIYPIELSDAAFSDVDEELIVAKSEFTDHKGLLMFAYKQV